MVTGGFIGGQLSSTELLEENADLWVYTGELPSPRAELRGANIDNKVLMTGKGALQSKKKKYGNFQTSVWHLPRLGKFPYIDKYLGGDFGSTTDEILEFDTISNQWTLVDRMIQARRYHAVSIVTFESDLCV